MTIRLEVTWKKLITLEGDIHEFNIPHLKCLMIHNCELSCLVKSLQVWCQQVHLDMECSSSSTDCQWSKSNSFVAAKIKSGMDRVWEILNTGTWKDVPEFIKHTYTLLCYYKVVAILNSTSFTNWTLKLVEECIQVLDKGILLGYNNSHISHAMQCLMEMYTTLTEPSDGDKRSEKNSMSSDVVMSSWKITGVRGSPVAEVNNPSLLLFQRDYLSVQRPAKLVGCVEHWPALQAWDLGYFRRLAGPRLVPIELGKKYTDEDWSQKLMSLNEFLDNHMREDSHAYLAQHDLLSQIPQLKRDIMVPDYCYLHTGTDEDRDTDEDTDTDDSESRAVDLNMWLGPPGTVTPFHWDAKHNLLVQVRGVKRVLLAAPEALMYPHEGLLNNTSRVDPESDPELLAREFPDFVRHPVEECTLHPGDMLYIPPLHWHHVRSLSTSISVSFWF